MPPRPPRRPAALLVAARLSLAVFASALGLDAQAPLPVFVMTMARQIATISTGGGSDVGLNDRGEVAGTTTFSAGPGFANRAFVWTAESGLRNLGVPIPLTPESDATAQVFASAINSFGQVAGDWRRQHAGNARRFFLWTPGRGSFHPPSASWRGAVFEPGPPRDGGQRREP